MGTVAPTPKQRQYDTESRKRTFREPDDLPRVRGRLQHLGEVVTGGGEERPVEEVDIGVMLEAQQNQGKEQARRLVLLALGQAGRGGGRAPEAGTLQSGRVSQ